MASDGRPKFDLHRFEEPCFQRLRDRARSLQTCGVYFSVMLFELYGFLDGEDVNGQRLWEGNPFNGANNINGVDVDRNHNRLGEEFFSLEEAELVDLQKAYVEKMVDTLNDLDNILWEICTEAPAPAFAWQGEMLRHLKAYEARKPKQHLVLLSPDGWKPGGWSTNPENQFAASPADWIAMTAGWCNRDDPKVPSVNEPVMTNLDHVAPGNHDPALVWKAFTRGYHYSLYDHPFEQPQDESPAWQVVRANIRQTCRISRLVHDLAAMTPRGELSSTAYCLASPGNDYLVYQPKAGESFAVELKGGTYRYEWFDPAHGAVASRGQVQAADGRQSFQAPFAGDAVLHLQRETLMP